MPNDLKSASHQYINDFDVIDRTHITVHEFEVYEIAVYICETNKRSFKTQSYFHAQVSKAIADTFSKVEPDGRDFYEANIVGGEYVNKPVGEAISSLELWERTLGLNFEQYINRSEVHKAMMKNHKEGDMFEAIFYKNYSVFYVLIF